MKKYARSVVVLIGLLFAGSTLAAKPVSIKFKNKVAGEEGEYLIYQVKCSNGVGKLISAWDNKRLWCQGEGGKDICNKKQIKTAKGACK